MIYRQASTPLIADIQVPFWQVVFLAFLPGATLILSLIFGAIPLASVTWAMLVPDMLAPVLFFWCIHRPKAVPILLIFVLGMMADIMHNSPLGVHTLAYMALSLAAKAAAPQLKGLGFFFYWGIFAIFMIGFMLLKLSASMLGTPSVLGYPTLLAILKSTQLFLTTIVAYPFFHLTLTLIHGPSKDKSDFADLPN